ncbi:MAG: hypothetical protein M0C28_02250 [Candidatus Moduliflexus flocculans]|nr:hypothetical protein [Candidatus Moduliflexus flocculans]
MAKVPPGHFPRRHRRPRGLPVVRAGRVHPVLPGHGPVLARGRRLHQVLDPRVAGRGRDPQRRSRSPDRPGTPSPRRGGH